MWNMANCSRPKQVPWKSHALRTAGVGIFRWPNVCGISLTHNKCVLMANRRCNEGIFTFAFNLPSMSSTHAAFQLVSDLATSPHRWCKTFLQESQCNSCNMADLEPLAGTTRLHSQHRTTSQRKVRGHSKWVHEFLTIIHTQHTCREEGNRVRTWKLSSSAHS